MTPFTLPSYNPKKHGEKVVIAHWENTIFIIKNVQDAKNLNF